MKSKKTLSIVLSALISLGLTSPAYAQGINSKNIDLNSAIAASNVAAQSSSKISKDDAKDIAKKALNDYLDIKIDDTQYQTSVNFRPNYMDGNSNKDYVWDISWNSHNQEKNVNINISVNANTGKIINLNNMTYFNGQPSTVATFTEDKAKEIGQAFLNKINPQEFLQCKLMDNDQVSGSMMGYQSTYNFNYYRTVNGIPFLGNFLNVGVDGITGKISSYSIVWSDKEVTELPKDVIISQDKANKIFKDNFKLQLKYISYRDQYGMGDAPPSLKLVYMPDLSNGVNIDIKEGKMLNEANTNALEKKVKDLNEVEKKSFIASYKPAEKLSKELDATSAEAIMKQIVKEIYGDVYDIQSTNYQDSNNGYNPNGSSWSGQFTKKDSQGADADQGNISIDSLTGQLLSVNKYNPFDRLSTSDANAEPKLSWEQAYDKSIGVITKYFSDKTRDINTLQTYTPFLDAYNYRMQGNRNYGFNFNRLLNGIPYQDDSININFDANTGNISGIYSSWRKNLKAPSAEGIMSQEAAQNILFKTYIPELSYTLANTSKDLKNPVMEVKLVYSIVSGLQYKQFNNIDAFTGKSLDYNGQEINNNMLEFKAKIKGIPEEKELSILASQGILITKDFDLNKEITRTDLIKMLVNAKGYRSYISESAADLKINYSGTKGDETYKYLQMAVSYGVLDNSGNFNGSEPITREEMIKSIAKLLGYDKLAKAKDIFQLKYSDVTDIAADNIGYVAISKGLGLTNDTDNKFMPKNKVTIRDAAVSIYKALDSLRK